MISVHRFKGIEKFAVLDYLIYDIEQSNLTNILLIFSVGIERKSVTLNNNNNHHHNNNSNNNNNNNNNNNMSQHTFLTSNFNRVQI